MNQREDFHEAIKIKERLYEESSKGNTRLHPSEQVRQRPDQPFAWTSEGCERVGSLIKLIFVVAGMELGWTVIFFLSQCEGVSLTGNGDSFVSDGVCKHCTKPTHTSHSRTRDFSRLAQDLSHRVNRNLCVSQNSRSSHLAQHVARGFVVVSFTLERCFTFHMHSIPTSFPTYPTFVAVHFTRRFTLRGSIECVFRPPG